MKREMQRHVTRFALHVKRVTNVLTILLTDVHGHMGLGFRRGK